MGDQEVEFGEKSLIIKNNGSTFEYRYADPSVIIAPPAGKSIELDQHFQFKLTAEDVNMITKAAAITAAESIIFEAKDGVFAVHVGDKANSMKQSKVLATETLRALPESYTVTLSKKKFLHFKSENAQVPQYWLALDPASVV
jgi:hypothetical protein